jgi:hypothetical protein
MIVDPNFLDHWKVSTLRAILGRDKEAPIYILRLWAYCQSAKKSTMPYNANVVAEICKFKGNPEAILQAMVELKIIDVVDDATLRVHEFDVYNKKLYSCRENAEKGREKANKKHSIESSNGNSIESSIESSNEHPVGSPIERGLDRIGLDRIGINTPKPPEGAPEWEVSFFDALKNSGKFPALTFDALRQAFDGYKKANLETKWPEIVEEMKSMPGTIQFPVTVLRNAISKLEFRIVTNLEKKDGAAAKGARRAMLIEIPENLQIGGMR